MTAGDVNNTKYLFATEPFYRTDRSRPSPLSSLLLFYSNVVWDFMSNEKKRSDIYYSILRISRRFDSISACRVKLPFPCGLMRYAKQAMQAEHGLSAGRREKREEGGAIGNFE